MRFKNSVKLETPSTWPRFKKGDCDGCWAGCCTLPLEVSLFDLIRLELVTEDEAATLAPKKIAKGLIKKGVVRVYTPRTGIFMIEQRQGRDCIFLDQKRMCTVYDKRPEVCRSFPKIGPRPGHCPCFPR